MHEEGGMGDHLRLPVVLNKRRVDMRSYSEACMRRSMVIPSMSCREGRSGVGFLRGGHAVHVIEERW